LFEDTFSYFQYTHKRVISQNDYFLIIFEKASETFNKTYEKCKNIRVKIRCL